MFNSPPFDVPTSSPMAGYGAKHGISSVEDDDDAVEVTDTRDKMDESDDVVEISPLAGLSCTTTASHRWKTMMMSWGTPGTRWMSPATTLLRFRHWPV
ncbi:hypothetical protein FRB94_004438 [Tulasnella sp. JGI-2019a]|nr:hypothetical protein FRB93_003604 [Tulasnella sp. JGI-2019a]KAG9001906.1 hypothetical protein FRB94_004438 [Tulasnella sp. JGI-2019a]KAG9029344.1 hypothetical protein FRB95_005460 [Tulasnella sp. JGI-2019a]